MSPAFSAALAYEGGGTYARLWRRQSGGFLDPLAVQSLAAAE